MLYYIIFYIISVQFSHSFVSDSLWPHGLQHVRPPCPSPTPRAYSNSFPWNQWCLPTISSSVVPFSFHLQYFPASGFFPMNQSLVSGSQLELQFSTSPSNERVFRLFSSITQLCLTLCDPVDCSMPGFPVHHQLLELTQTHVH